MMCLCHTFILIQKNKVENLRFSSFRYSFYRILPLGEAPNIFLYSL